MYRKFLFLPLFLSIFTFGNFNAFSFASEIFKSNTHCTYIHSLSSLHCYLEGLQNNLSNENNEFETISFSDEEIAELWDNSFIYLLQSESDNLFPEIKIFERAFEEYRKFQESSEPSDKLEKISKTRQLIHYLWQIAVKYEETLLENKEACELELLAKSRSSSSNHEFENNPFISTTIKKRMRPYLIPNNHPMKPVLDKLFSQRVTVSMEALLEHGFNIIDKRERSHVCVVSHPELQDHLLKLHFDYDSRRKRGKPSWYWLVQRCIGAQKIQKIIREYKVKHFICANKWIYPLPAHPSPPKNSKYIRHLAVLCCTDMKLIPSEQNYYAWSHNITHEILDELYLLVTRGKGSSYRPDNIWFNHDGLICFIDTEYPDKGPDFESIKRFLNPKMLSYWEKIIKAGGPKQYRLKK